MSAAKYNFEDAINTFFVESRELLDDMENGLLDLEKDITNREPVPAIFRAVHTIKGSAGMFGFADIGDFAHVVEDMLDDVRNDVIELIPDMISLLLDCRDHVLKMLNFFDGNRSGKIDEGLKSVSINLIQQVNTYISTPGKKTAGESIAKKDNEAISDIQVINESWHISLRFGPDTFKNGLDPQSFISYLGQMGKIVNIKTIMEAFPKIDKLDPESCYIGFEINFQGYTTKEKIEEVFEFVRDDCKIRILPPKSDLSEYVNLIEDLSEKPRSLGEILIEIGSLTKKELEEALKLQILLKGQKKDKRIGEVVVEEQMVPKSVVEAAVNKQTNIKKAEDSTKKSMRIDTSKLDTLVNLVGELVISAANVEQVARNTGDNKLVKTVTQLSKLISEVRENFMNIRMVQIGESFKRFERVVRDISIDKGKKVDLILNGGETELDKTIIEKVVDPLMHLVRNAVDHGIDLPEERIRKGKPAVGKVTLNAYHEAGTMVIEITDDGSGLNKEKIIHKAIERNLITSEQALVMSDDEIFKLIFTPGFSTADKVTEISGRGVGMDVVKKNIDSLKGFVSIQSKEGKGTSVRIFLPLTLAIIDGFLVKAGNLFCVLPLAMVSECANISKSKKELIKYENGDFMNLRGDIVPFIRMRDLFNENGDLPEMEDIAIVEYGGKKVGFVVDGALGEFQTVVKPLGRIFKNVEWISGATILVGGEVGLILDIPKLVQYLQAIEVKKAS